MITRIGATPTVSRQNINNRKNNPNFGILILPTEKKSIENIDSSEIQRIRQGWRKRVFLDDGHGPANLNAIKAIAEKVQAKMGRIPPVLANMIDVAKEESAKVGLKY